MLKTQHIPLSVGIVLKIVGQSNSFSFQKHFLMMEVLPAAFEVMFLTSKQGNWEYHMIVNKLGKLACKSMFPNSSSYFCYAFTSFSSLSPFLSGFNKRFIFCRFLGNKSSNAIVLSSSSMVLGVVFLSQSSTSTGLSSWCTTCLRFLLCDWDLAESIKSIFIT